MDYLNSKENKIFVREVCNIIKEKNIDLIQKCFILLGKEHLLFLLQKTLTIENEGGMCRSNSNCGEDNTKKTTGGVLLKLIKTEGCLNKQLLKELFRKDYTLKNENRKLLKKLGKMLI
jgi:hypothetical protein